MSFEVPFAIIGHRGAAGLAPENTLASFRRAVELGVDGVELDVYNIQGHLLVLHDDTLERTTNGRGRVQETSLEKLRELDAGQGQQIPLLEEVYNLIPPPIGINIELKGEATAGLTAQLIRNFPQHASLVSSFSFPELQRFRRVDPVTKVAPVFHKTHPDMLDIARELDAWSIHLSRRIMNRSLCDQIRAAGFECLVWTVNSPKEGEKFREMGAKGIFTDYPDRFLPRPERN